MLAALKKIWKFYSLEYSVIAKVFLAKHHVGDCCINDFQGHCCATVCSTTMILTHFCTNVAACIVKALECPDMVAKAADR